MPGNSVSHADSNTFVQKCFKMFWCLPLPRKDSKRSVKKHEKSSSEKNVWLNKSFHIPHLTLNDNQACLCKITGKLNFDSKEIGGSISPAAPLAHKLSLVTTEAARNLPRVSNCGCTLGCLVASNNSTTTASTSSCESQLTVMCHIWYKCQPRMYL